MIDLVFCLLLNLVYQNVAHVNNVCKSFLDYKTIEINKNCWYNPDMRSSTEEISTRYGYNAEKHKIMTEDGYMLILYRVSNNRINLRKSRQPVILQYGVGGTTEFWLLRGENSTAFTLCDHDYDVWLTNTRGSPLEVANEKYLKNDPKYWNYCFHENGIYDLPAMIEYISNITKYKQKLIYVGHSMGTTMSYIYAIERSKQAQQNLKGIISLSPVMYLKNSSPTYQAIGSAAHQIYNLAKYIGVDAVGKDASFRNTIFVFCSTYPTILICDQILSAGNGKSLKESRPDLVPVFMSYFPTATTLKSLYHFAQMIASKKFQQYDYGSLNLEKYNATTPPYYDVNQISVPVHFFIGTNDAIATLSDVDILYKKLKHNGVSTSKHILDYAHNDFFIGRYYLKFHKYLLNVLENLK